jgi:hypothetical protein
MAAGSIKRLAGPVALSNTLTTNIYNPASGMYGVIQQIHIVNKTGASATFSLWLGATGANAAGTELYSLESVAAQTGKDYWFSPGLKLGNADFLVGGASALTTLTATVMGYEAATIT